MKKIILIFLLCFVLLPFTAKALDFQAFGVTGYGMEIADGQHGKFTGFAGFDIKLYRDTSANFASYLRFDGYGSNTDSTSAEGGHICFILQKSGLFGVKGLFVNGGSFYERQVDLQPDGNYLGSKTELGYAFGTTISFALGMDYFPGTKETPARGRLYIGINMLP